MSFESCGLLKIYYMPDDAPEFIRDRGHAIAAASRTLNMFMFQWSSRILMADVEQAHARGVHVRELLDNKQAKTPTERKVLGSHIERIGVENVLTTDSPAHQIMHAKLLAIDDHLDVPEQQFSSMAEAFAAPYPVTFLMSENFSDKADGQVNTIVAVPGHGCAQWATSKFEELWAYAISRQKRPA